MDCSYGDQKNSAVLAHIKLQRIMKGERDKETGRQRDRQVSWQKQLSTYWLFRVSQAVIAKTKIITNKQRTRSINGLTEPHDRVWADSFSCLWPSLARGADRVGRGPNVPEISYTLCQPHVSNKIRPGQKTSFLNQLLSKHWYSHSSN